MPRNIVGSRFRTLEETITQTAGMPQAQWPELKRLDRSDPPRTDCQEEIDTLRGECARIAKELEIAVWTLAPRAALEAIARSRPRSLVEIMETGGLLRWQAELVQGAVEKTLHSTQEKEYRGGRGEEGIGRTLCKLCSREKKSPLDVLRARPEFTEGTNG